MGAILATDWRGVRAGTGARAAVGARVGIGVGAIIGEEIRAIHQKLQIYEPCLMCFKCSLQICSEKKMLY